MSPSAMRGRHLLFMHLGVSAGEFNSYLRESFGELAMVNVLVRVNFQKNLLARCAPAFNFAKQILVKKSNWLGIENAVSTLTCSSDQIFSSSSCLRKASTQ